MTQTQVQHTPYDARIAELEGLPFGWKPAQLVELSTLQTKRDGYLAAKVEDADLVAVSEAVVAWYENSGSADPAPGSVELWSKARAALAALTDHAEPVQTRPVTH